MSTKVNTQILDQIIFDSTMSLSDELLDLAQMPENFINSVCDKHYDEMSSDERAAASAEIEAYLKANMEPGSYLYRTIKNRINEGYTHVFSAYEAGAWFEKDIHMNSRCAHSRDEAITNICSERMIATDDFWKIEDKCLIWDLAEELEREKLEMA